MFVKVCGTTSEEDALLAVAMGADAVGFVFAPSPRQIAPVRARDIAKRLPPEIVTVGVFRDEVPERVVRLVNGNGLKAAQLHGHESADAVRWVGERVGLTIKAFPAGHDSVVRAAEFDADVILLDGASPGSGTVFDWRLAEGLREPMRLLMSGGLTPDNVGAAISLVRPWGVDVASGVESSPGHKDASKVRAFVSAARDAEVPQYEPDERPPFDWQAEV